MGIYNNILSSFIEFDSGLGVTNNIKVTVLNERKSGRAEEHYILQVWGYNDMGNHTN